MAEAKQVSLNGAYYGPPIPPQQGYRAPHDRRTGSCCCLLSTLSKLILAIVVALGIAALVLWLIYRPSEMKVYVTSADLHQFNLTGGNTLHYNLSLAIAIRNPNKNIGISYNNVEARAYYGGERFGYAPLPPFYQGHKVTTNLYTVITGQAAIPLSSADVAEYDREKGEGIFSIDVKIHARIRFKIGSLKTNRYKPDIECELRLPLPTNSSSLAVARTSTKCDVDF